MFCGSVALLLLLVDIWCDQCEHNMDVANEGIMPVLACHFLFWASTFACNA
jgi:cytosine/uracil/thiamine/allantoin permease